MNTIGALCQRALLLLLPVVALNAVLRQSKSALEVVS
jgi:hypothetical protein